MHSFLWARHWRVGIVDDGGIRGQGLKWFNQGREDYGGGGSARPKNLLNTALILSMGARLSAYLRDDLVTILTHCRRTNGSDNNQSSTDFVNKVLSRRRTLVGPSAYSLLNSLSVA
jgi:hypothetical protein